MISFQGTLLFLKKKIIKITCTCNHIEFWKEKINSLPFVLLVQILPQLNFHPLRKPALAIWYVAFSSLFLSFTFTFLHTHIWDCFPLNFFQKLNDDILHITLIFFCNESIHLSKYRQNYFTHFNYWITFCCKAAAYTVQLLTCCWTFWLFPVFYPNIINIIYKTYGYFPFSTVCC